MRRPGRHAVIAAFSPANERTLAVLRRGKPLSSVARFRRTDMAPTSLLMDAYRLDDNLVRIELLVKPEQTTQLRQGIGFDLLAGDALLGTGTILSGNIRQIAGIKSCYRDLIRGEMNPVAKLYHLLHDRQNLGKFLELTAGPEVESIVEDEFGLVLEYACLRDMWDGLKESKEGNEKKRKIIEGCVGAVLTDSVSQRSVKEFNEYFGAGNQSRSPSREYIESPHNWQLDRIKDLDKIDDDNFLNLCKFKWSFGARPDMVIHISNEVAVCVEAKTESRESKYPDRDPLRREFARRNLEPVYQTDLQKHLMTILLGLRTHFVYVTKAGSSPKAAGYTPVSWERIFSALPRRLTPPGARG